MARQRFKALEEVLSRTPVQIDPPKVSVSVYYGENVFDMKTMQEYMSEEAFKSVEDAIQKGTQVDRRMADQISAAMKAWATERGASHYTHWFQPLTGATAEKHDAFFEPLAGGGAIERFGGGQLVQQEPDASSFPNGGIRNTFEARGYTAWDPTSPAFVIGRTLCIPTIFVSYTGEALDYKTPLLKALNFLDKSATEVCQYFDKNVTKVTATLGWEQEYFLIDTALFNCRPDLMMTGRTVLGHAPAKGQQLDDHYFGSIPDRVTSFMRDFEFKALELGIPIKTRHNEVAPNQFECAPIFEETNLAVDHNQLLMDLLEKVARRHNFRVLLHEKPFAGVNGSGKHNNWSMSTNTGKNLLSPGKTPKTNMQFLTFFINTIKAVNDNADLLRASIASAGNDHRLGANEAPPAIMSIFIGSQLTQVLQELETKVKDGKMTPDEKTALKLNIGKIPEILLDNTDRNRTSPFAFTGNKFEFRAVGSSANCAGPMTVLNTIVGKQLTKFKEAVDKMIADGIDKDEAIFQELRNLIIDSKKILFEGNGYGDEWVKEAEKRGLSNVRTTPEALDAYIAKGALKLFESCGIMSEKEQYARHEIRLETYTKKIQIESRVLGDIAQNHIIPTAIKYQSFLIENVRGLKEISGTQIKALAFAGDEMLSNNGSDEADETSFAKAASVQMHMIEEISEHISAIKTGIDEMIEARKEANAIEDMREQAIKYCNVVKPYFDQVRYHVDKLELLVDDEMWPLPKYREMLFTK